MMTQKRVQKLFRTAPLPDRIADNGISIDGWLESFENLIETSSWVSKNSIFISGKKKKVSCILHFHYNNI